MPHNTDNQDSDHDQNSGAYCAHLRISWRTKPCDGYSIRGEVMPCAGTRGWWECDSNCGAKFTPRLPVTGAEVAAEEARQAAMPPVELPPGLRDPYKIIDKHLLREALASLEHDRWSRWQGYLHSKCTRNPDGSLTIPPESVQHWERQIKTPYWDLSGREKDSDRKEADNTLAVLAEHGGRVK